MASVFKRGGRSNRGGFWHIAWFDHNGKRRTKCSRTTDKAAAERIAAKLEAGAALRREGVIDVTLEGIAAQGRRTIEAHLVDYEAMLRATSSDKHVVGTLRYIRAICLAMKLTAVADITADSVNHFTATLKETGLSSRTIQAHLVAIKGFTKWLADHGKAAANLLSSIKRPNPDVDRRFERRILLPDEWNYLRKCCTETRFCMAAEDRVLLYATAIQTGLRSNELRSLTPGKLFLESEPPYVLCKASATKNAKEARQYIRPDLAVGLREHIRSRSPQRPVFRMPEASDVASMLRADLSDARTAWLHEAADNPEELKRRLASDFLMETNHEGEVLDFHSLRHSTGAWLAMSGAHPKAVQTVMRHSQITLTMDVYGHLFPGQESQTIALLPVMLPSDLLAQRQRQQLERDSVPGAASGCSVEQKRIAAATSRKPSQVSSLCDSSSRVATTCDRSSCPNKKTTPLTSCRRCGNRLIPGRMAGGLRARPKGPLHVTRDAT